MSTNCQKCAIGIGISLIIFGFGISEIVIFTKGTKYLDTNTQCQKFPIGIPEINANKIISNQWHWTYQKSNTYNDTTFKISIKQKCPTMTHDANVYLNDILIARTDGKVITLTSKVNINDCHGNTLFVFEASDFEQVIINQNKIFVNKQIKDTNKNILGYVKGKNFFVNNDISILDKNGNNVADISRNKLSFDWVWKFKIYDYNSPLSDMRLLASIAGKQAFGEDDNKTDICNDYFWNLAWTLIAIISCIIFGILYIIFIKCQKCMKLNNNEQPNDQNDQNSGKSGDTTNYEEHV
jgi:heme/copper-type cytochrome/quinol oxidase subunit 2